MAAALWVLLPLVLIAQPLTKPPNLEKFVEAPYPVTAQKEGREGDVVLAIDVDISGNVQRVEILESAGLELDRAALEAAAQFEFSPAEAGELGVVPVRITYRYRFLLTPITVSSTLAQSSTAAPESLALFSEMPQPPEAINFLGTVKQAGTRAEIPFASVTLRIAASPTSSVATRTSTDADEHGRFAFRGVSAGRHELSITAPFFAPFEAKELIRAHESLEVLYYLERSKKDPYEVVVRAKAPRKEVARRTLVLEEILRIPGTQGDAIRVVQNMPGVARTPFGLGLLVVRGAPPQDTGVFLDGHRLPLLFHFGGIAGVTSVVHSQILDQINFFPGGFSPAYGRISGGMVELLTREAKTDRVHGEAQLELYTVVPTAVSVFLEGPVTRDPEDGAFVFSLRRSSVDGVFSLASTILDQGVQAAPRFWDYQVRYDKPLGRDRSRMLTLFAYGSDDEIVITGTDQAGPNAGGPSSTQSRTYFHRFNPRLVYRPDGDTQLTLSPIIGLDFTNTTIDSSDGGRLSLRLEDWNTGLRVDAEHRLVPELKLRLGGDVLYFRYQGESVIPFLGAVKDFPSPVTLDVPTRVDKAEIPAVLAALYLEAEWKPTPAITLWPGVRLDVYGFRAEPQPLLIDERLIEGRTKAATDPRLTARFQLLESLALKGQAGLYNQPPLPPQLFINADLPLQVAQQYSWGVEWEIADQLSLDLQGYFRYAGNVPRFTTDVEVVDGKVRAVGLRPDGARRAYGMEMLLRLDHRWDLFGWLAYTLSRSEVLGSDDEFRQDFFFDQTHNLILVASYEIALNWSIGIRFRLVTGGGLPKTLARFYDSDLDGYRRTTEDVERTPPFHQLDINIQKRWVYDEWCFEASFDVQNVYNNTNVEFLIPTFDFKGVIEFPGLPIFPSFILKGVF